MAKIAPASLITASYFFIVASSFSRFMEVAHGQIDAKIDQREGPKPGLPWALDKSAATPNPRGLVVEPLSLAQRRLAPVATKTVLTATGDGSGRLRSAFRVSAHNPTQAQR